MICGTCGRNNASHLVFCEECGEKLAPRLGVATPPLGVPATGGSRGTAEPRRAATAQNARVEPVQAATVERSREAVPRPATASPSRAGERAAARPARAAASSARCNECGSTNAEGLRYCNTCGAPLRASAIPHAGSPTREAAPGEITPARVVSLNGPEGNERSRADGALRVCLRCRGANHGVEPFCRFCGAPLAAAGGGPSPKARLAPAAAGESPPSLTAVSRTSSIPAAPAGRPTFEPAVRPLPGELRTPVTRAVPATAAAAPRLVMMSPAGTEGKVVPLFELTDVGRTEGDVTLPDDPYLSPRHARLTRRGATTWLEDLSSTNGVYLRIRRQVTEGDDEPRRLEVPLADERTTPGDEDTDALVDPDQGDRTTDVGAARAAGGSGAHRRRISALVPAPGRFDDPGAAPWASRRPATVDPLVEGLPGAGRRTQTDAREAAGAGTAGLPYALLPQHVLRDQDLFLVGEQVLSFDVVTHAEAGFRAASQHGTLLFGSPITPRYARISQRTVEGVSRDVFYLRKAETVLGRESGDVVFSEDPFLSRRHAAICTEGEGDARRFLLVDLGSSNGTFVRIRHEIPLHAGDQFRVGQQLFRFDLA